MDERFQVARAGFNPFQEIASILRETSAVVGADQRCEADDRPERSSKIVGHSVGKGFQFTVAGVEFLCSFLDAPFQFSYPLGL